MFLANPHFSPTSLATGLDTRTFVEMTTNKPLILVIYLTFARIFTLIFLPGLVLEYTFRTLTSALRQWPAILMPGFLLFLGVTWTTSSLASSSSDQLLVTSGTLCASGLLILLKLFFLLVVVIVGSLLLAGQAVSEHGILALLREIFQGCLSKTSALPRLFLKRSSSLPISCSQTSRRDAIRENPNLRKLFVRPDILPPPPQKGTSCSAKFDIFRAMGSEVNNATHRRIQESRRLKERFGATDVGSVERIALLDGRMAEFEARKVRGFIPLSELGETTTAIVAQAATLGVRLGLDDYEGIRPDGSGPLDYQATVTRMRIEHSYLVTVIRRLKKMVEERDNTIREQAKKFVAFEDGVRDTSKRWEKTFDTLSEKLKARDAEIDDLKREISMKNDSKMQLKAQRKRREHLCARVDACAGRVHQSFEQSDLFQEPAQRRFRRDHQATLARPLATPPPSGYSSSVNTSGVVKTVKLTRAGKRRILRPVE